MLNLKALALPALRRMQLDHEPGTQVLKTAMRGTVIQQLKRRIVRTAGNRALDCGCEDRYAVLLEVRVRVRLAVERGGVLPEHERVRPGHGAQPPLVVGDIVPDEGTPVPIRAADARESERHASQHCVRLHTSSWDGLVPVDQWCELDCLLFRGVCCSV